LAKFTLLHSKSALVTETCFVAYKIWNNFCFGEISAPVQILAEFCKTTEQVDMGCYSAEQGGVLCRRSRAATSGTATRLATQLLGCARPP
jgi:hypothetical protein